MGSQPKSYLRRSIHSGVAAIFLLALLNDVCLGQQRGRSRAGVGIAVAAGAASGGQLVDFDCPEEFGYYPHPNDCTQYYVCVFGGALLESCTGGLMYSHELQTCDWPRNVGCGAEESATISTVRVTDPRTRQTTASGASPRTAPISRGQQQREQQQRQQQDEIAKHQLYADDLGPAEEVETDRQQRVYRGQPSTIGQVARDRDGLRHQVTNAIPASPGRVATGDKVSVISFGTGLQQQQQQAQQYRVEPSNPPVTYVQQAPAPSPSVYNNSQRYEASQYDPYYNLYDDEVELYKDVDYGQYSQQSDRQTSAQQQQQQQQQHQQQQYRGQSPYKQVPQPPPQEQRNTAYAQPTYNTQQDVYSQNVETQDYNENYNTAADDQGQYGQQARQPVKTPTRSGRNESNIASQRPSTTSTTTTTTTTTTSTTIRTTTALPSTTTTTVAPERQQTRLRTEPYANTINNAAENYSARARISTTTKSTPFPEDFDTPYILTLQNQKPTRQTPSGQHDSPQSRTVTLTTAFSLLDPFSTEQSRPSTSQSRGRGQPSNRVSIESFGDSSSGRQSSQIITLGAPVSRSSSRNQAGTNNSRKTASASFVVVDNSKSSNLEGFSLEDEVAAIEGAFNTQQTRKQGNEIQSRSRNPPQYNRNQETKRLASSESGTDRSRPTPTISSRRPIESDAEFIQVARRPTDSSSITSSALVNDVRNPSHSRRTSESSDGSNSDSSRIRRPTETSSNPITSRNNLEFPSSSSSVRSAPQSRNSNEASSSDSTQTLTQSRRPVEPSVSSSSSSKLRSSSTRNNADSETLPKSRASNLEKETPSSPRSSYRANIVEADDVQSGLAQNSIEQQSEISSNTRSRQRGSNQRKSSTSCNDAIDTNANTGCDESPSQIRVRPTSASPESQSTPTPSRGSSAGRTRGGSYTTGTGAEQTVNRGTPASVSRSRPTLKPSTAIVSKAQEFIDIYKYPASRPEPVYATPQVDKTAAKCRKDVCLLPDCSCGGKEIPGDLPAEEVPQIVLLTFDDAINDLNKGLYSDIFEKDRKNPNGCPISATFYVSHEWTDYSQAQNLYADGHEMASHSISHSFGEQFSQKKWTREIAGQREILAAYGGVRMEDIRGMRAPFLAIGGNKMFKMLYDSNFTYDSSMPVYENRPPSWPYTLDYKIFHDCMIPPCPTRSYPGVWEVPMVMWQDLNGGRCSMGDACSNPPTADGVYKMLIKNFERHYTTNRAPFGLFYHAAWFTQPHHKEGFIAFLDTIVNMQDVWLVTNWQAIQWVRDPTPLSRIKNFPPFQCNYPERPRKCNNPKVCNLWHKSGVRYMRTCQPCPEVYPWTGKTGVRNSRVDNEIIEE